MRALETIQTYMTDWCSDDIMRCLIILLGETSDQWRLKINQGKTVIIWLWTIINNRDWWHHILQDNWVIREALGTDWNDWSPSMNELSIEASSHSIIDNICLINSWYFKDHDLSDIKRWFNQSHKDDRE